MAKLTASYFEIPVTDLKRAMDFYGYVFDIKFKVENIDGNDMALFPSNIGALAKGESYQPSLDGTRIYFDIESIDEVMKKALEKGGKKLYPKTSIGELGFVAEIQDSEGNCIALSSMK
jgi:uncharacterized protein